MSLFKRISSNIAFRKKIFNTTPAYVKERTKYGLKRALRPYLNFSIWVTTEHGAKILLSKEVVDEYILDDLYSEQQFIYFPAYLSMPSNATVLDVGAHHGLYAMELLARYKDTNIICVEPDPESGAIVRKHIEKNNASKQVELVPFAIGEEEKESFLVDNEDGSWGKTVESADTGNGLKIKLKTLAGVLGNKRNVDVIKSNCEGGEFALIPQVIELKLKPQLIILMIHPDRGDAKALISSLEAYGYAASCVWDSKENPCWHFQLKQV